MAYTLFNNLYNGLTSKNNASNVSNTLNNNTISGLMNQSQSMGYSNPYFNTSTYNDLGISQSLLNGLKSASYMSDLVGQNQLKQAGSQMLQRGLYSSGIHAQSLNNLMRNLAMDRQAQLYGLSMNAEQMANDYALGQRRLEQEQSLANQSTKGSLISGLLGLGGSLGGAAILKGLL